MRIPIVITIPRSTQIPVTVLELSQISSKQLFCFFSKEVHVFYFHGWWSLRGVLIPHGHLSQKRFAKPLSRQLGLIVRKITSDMESFESVGCVSVSNNELNLICGSQRSSLDMRFFNYPGFYGSPLKFTETRMSAVSCNQWNAWNVSMVSLHRFWKQMACPATIPHVAWYIPQPVKIIKTILLARSSEPILATPQPNGVSRWSRRCKTCGCGRSHHLIGWNSWHQEMDFLMNLKWSQPSMKEPPAVCADFYLLTCSSSLSTRPTGRKSNETPTPLTCT